MRRDGHAGTFAFYPNKQMTTGEGGVVVTDDPALDALIKSLRNQGTRTRRGAGSSINGWDTTTGSQTSTAPWVSRSWRGSTVFQRHAAA